MLTRGKIEDLITQEGWQPIKIGIWTDLKGTHTGATISFEGHDQYKYRCTHSEAARILALGKVEVK